MTIIDIGKSDKCCGMDLVYFSQVQGLGHFLLKPLTLDTHITLKGATV